MQPVLAGDEALPELGRGVDVAVLSRLGKLLYCVVVPSGRVVLGRADHRGAGCEGVVDGSHSVQWRRAFARFRGAAAKCISGRNGSRTLKKLEARHGSEPRFAATVAPARGVISLKS